MMMDATAVVKGFLDANGAAASVQTETVFAYHASFGGDSRISGCEVRLRLCGERVEISIVLPVSVQHLEFKGVADCISALNEEIGREGCFDLDRLAGRIMYRRLVAEAEEEALKAAMDAALVTVAERSDGLMKMVCDESSAAQKRELKRIRQEERASRGDSPLTGMLKKYMAALKAKIDAKNAVGLPVPVPVPVETDAAEPKETTPVEPVDEEPVYEVSEPENEEAAYEVSDSDDEQPVYEVSEPDDEPVWTAEEEKPVEDEEKAE